MRLSAQDIYDINKDAIVRLNGGNCTAEVISSQGLVLTNHHCAYGAIQSFSTPENDYSTDGFWAKAKDQEMHIDDFYVSFLVRIDDVTERVLSKGERRYARGRTCRSRRRRVQGHSKRVHGGGSLAQLRHEVHVLR